MHTYNLNDTDNADFIKDETVSGIFSLKNQTRVFQGTDVTPAGTGKHRKYDRQTDNKEMLLTCQPAYARDTHSNKKI